MSSSNSLTSLARARSWAGVTTNNDDSTLILLIAEVSSFITSYLSRASLFTTQYTETLDGMGQKSLLLKNWPVTGIATLEIDDIPVTEAVNSVSAGYVLEKWDGISHGTPQRLSLRGYSFSRGVGNVAITYDAGYRINAEAHNVPSSGTLQVNVNAPYGNWGSDQGVAYANGIKLIAVAANPAQGQYTVASGVYGFALADAGSSVLISYGYIPSDIEHACVALVAERYRYRTRIGEISKSLGGQETATYSQKNIPEFVRILLQPYRRVLS